MDHQSTAVLRTELPRFGLWSLESQRIAFAQYSKAQAVSAEKEEKMWTEYLESNGENQDEMQALGQKVLASSIYGPNAEPVFPAYEGFEDCVAPSPIASSSPDVSKMSIKDDDSKEEEEDNVTPSRNSTSPTRPPRPSRSKKSSADDEEIAVATPVVPSPGRKPSVEGDSGMFFNPDEAGGEDDDEEDDGIFI